MKKQVMEQQITVNIHVVIPYEPGEDQSEHANDDNVWLSGNTASGIMDLLKDRLTADAEVFPGGQCTIYVVPQRPFMRDRTEQEINLDANGAHNA